MFLTQELTEAASRYNTAVFDRVTQRHGRAAAVMIALRRSMQIAVIKIVILVVGAVEYKLSRPTLSLIGRA